MIKLTFNNFSFTTDGIVSKAKVTATIKWFNHSKWITVANKEFRIKITLKKEDTPDLNKAYKYAKARLEHHAYMWAGHQAKLEAQNQAIILCQLNDFSDKANYIVSHNVKYIKELYYGNN